MTSEKILHIMFLALMPVLTGSGKISAVHVEPAGNMAVVSPVIMSVQQQDYPNDFGDAPKSYGSADHVTDGARYLGTAPDGEASMQYSDEADGDDLHGTDDEDGAEIPGLMQGATATIPVKIVAPAFSYVYLNVWFDWNGDGDFEDTKERVASDIRRLTGSYNLSVTVPADAVGNKPIFARFRLGPRSTNAPVYGSTGSASYGEVEDYMVKITCAEVKIPQVSEIIQPSCQVSTGTVKLGGLPGTGTWTLTRLPDGMITTGTGTTVVVTGVPAGTWKYTVTNQSGCSSLPTNDIVINPAPVVPGAPVPGELIQPDCLTATGSVVLNSLPPSGNWIITRNPGGILYHGSGTSTTISGLSEGQYYFLVTNSDGCTSVESSAVIINSQPETPSAPLIGTVIQPDCDTPTGSVSLTGLPGDGTWVLTRLPDNITITGTGTGIVVTGISPGIFRYTVTNEAGCTSQESAAFEIIAHPARPSAPVVETIIQPTCTVSTGSVILTGLPSSGTWSLTRLPDGTVYSGSGTTTTVGDLIKGTYYFMVTNAAGCVSEVSAAAEINAQPPTPTPPVPGDVTHPTCDMPSGSVMINGLPPTGTWTLTRYPGTIITTGTGPSLLISGLDPGTYNFTVTNVEGCTSSVSDDVIINPRPGPSPTLVINDPDPVCSPATADLTDPDITRGSTPNLTLTYWKDAQATIPYSTPSAATAGTYYIRGTLPAGCSDIKPVTVQVYDPPVSDAGPDQELEFISTTTLDAGVPGENETGKWSVISGEGEFFDETDAKTTVFNLSQGENVLQWSVTNGVCQPATDYVMITVHDLLVPTLITPDMNGKNDYFVLQGIEALGKTAIHVYDRRGMLVYENDDYDNMWNGVDYNGNPLPDDTYFIVIDSENSRSLSGYVVIRR